MKVVIAEKPSVAKDLARVLGATTRHDGWFGGNGYGISWAFGHLVRLIDPNGTTTDVTDCGWDHGS